MDTRKFSNAGLVPGVLLVGFGLLFLLQTLGIIGSLGRLSVGLVFLGGAAVALMTFLQDRTRWWSIFPTFFLGFIGLAILRNGILPHFGMGSLFLGGLGASFLAVYATRREHVWPIIPGGVLLTLAVVNLLDWAFFPLNNGSVFFLGLAATFGAVYWYGPRPQYNWALIVAAILGGFGMLLLVGSLLKIVFPLVLVGLGVLLLMRHRNS